MVFLYIYIQEHLNCNTLDDLTYSRPYVLDIVSISMLINNKQTIISGIYKSPNSIGIIVSPHSIAMPNSDTKCLVNLLIIMLVFFKSQVIDF